MQSLYTAATGMLAQQMNIDVISNNLANVNTNGFKQQRVDFQDLLYLNVKPAGTPATRDTKVPVGIQVGDGVRPVDTQRSFAQGAVQTTSNPLDLLIEGAGYFFKVTRPDGDTAYTQDGSFSKDGEGNIVTSDGYMLDPAIQIPTDATSVTVSATGKVTATLNGDSTTTQEIGQLQLSRFVNPAGLESMGHNVFLPTAASGDAIDGVPGSNGYPSIQQGSLEASNVDVVDQMVKMIMAQRAYEMNSKAVQTADDMLATNAAMKSS
jgi:flagellar basal-body rod protein FlgG